MKTYNGINFDGTEYIDAGHVCDIWLNWDDAASFLWLKQRFLALVYVAADAGESVRLTGLGALANGVVYKLDANRYVIIDLTDYVRAIATQYDDIMTISARIEPNDETTFIYGHNIFTGADHDNDFYKGLIEPHKLINNAGFNDFSGTHLYDTIIMPPSMMLYVENSHTRYQEIIAEMYGKPISSIRAVNATIITKGDLVRGVEVNADFTIQAKSGNNWPTLKSYQLTEPSACRTYVLVEWISQTGAKRRHIFYTDKFKEETANAYELLMIDNSYKNIKGLERSMTLSLDGLNMYDLWYYADILTSSSVKIFVRQAWQQVNVKTKGITIPDGESGTDGKLEFEINYDRYDAVTL